MNGFVRHAQASLHRSHPGSSLIEVIIAMALIVVFSLTFMQMVLGSYGSSSGGQKLTEAVAYARQGLEAARSIGEQDFAELTLGDHGLTSATGIYAFSGSLNVQNGYTRTVSVGVVGRDGNGDIVQSAGANDAYARLVTSIVTWNEGAAAKSVSLQTYLTNWRAPVSAGLIVQKIVINHGGTKTAADFAPYMVGTGTVTLGATNTLPAGTYQVSEQVHPEYVQTFGNDCDAFGQVSLGAGDSKTCTITNEENVGTVTVNKVVINHGGTKTAADFVPYNVGTTTVTQGAGTSFPVGTYVISEAVDANYTQTFSGDCSATGVVTVTIGSAKVCTITNEEKQATITVRKVVSGGTKTISDFAPYKVGTTTVTENVAAVLDSGTYTVSEVGDPNYLQTFGGDCDASGQVTLTPGSNKICTITNTYTGIPIQATYTVTIQNLNQYRINGQNNPLLTLQRGRRYIFIVNAPGQPFWIKTPRSSKVTGSANAYTSGVQNNGTELGTIIFDVPLTAPSNQLYYISGNRSQMNDNIDTSP